MSAGQWRHKDIWSMSGPNFMVQVSRHEEAVRDESFGEGPHRWCVYAYIYPEHRRFELFEGEAMFQPAASALHFHGGPSFLRRHNDQDGKCTSVQVGGDYHHLYDERFTRYATQKDAYEVFADALTLYEQLSEEQP